MGNRAYVVLTDEKETPVTAIYLHWNGGPESVYTFLDYLYSVGVHSADYGAARLVQIIGNYFGGKSSLGLAPAPGSLDTIKGQAHHYDPGDNGIYLIALEDRDWRCLGRYRRDQWSSYHEIGEEIGAAKQHEYNAKGELLAAIKKANDAFFAKP